MNRIALVTMGMIAAATLLYALTLAPSASRPAVPPDRREVIFWHFWGGADREVVEEVVARFNRSQDRHFVRAVAMPGHNLDLKLFLAVTGGDPPDLVNQDDPITADWAQRGALTPLDELAAPDEIARLENWLVPAAGRLGTYRGRLYALCNGLDIRALYYNQSLLEEHGLGPPRELAELDYIAEQLTARDAQGRYVRFGYLPDPRRLWAWGVVFGGDFYDEQQGRVTADDPAVVAALEWMTGYREKYGAAAVAAFRQGDQSLPGQTFPLLAGRYAMVMDGQWRVRDIVAAQAEQRSRGEPVTQYGVCPLPPPPAGVANAGWVNGNFFLVPRGAKNSAGAWQFMKFWCGFDGHEQQAAQTCVAGGWIPVSQEVVRQQRFAEFLDRQPLFARFVQLAGHQQQVPTPVIPGARFFQRTIHDAAARAMYEQNAPPPEQILREATQTVQTFLDGLQNSRVMNTEY